MKKFVMVTLFIVSFSVFSETAIPPAGSGTQLDPYRIASLENLYWIAADPSRWSNFYTQTADIDASSTSGWFSGAGWSPIGSSLINFLGSYDGQNHTIDGLFINRNTADNQGLFGVVGYQASVLNIGVTNVNISGKDFVGALAGILSNASNCYTTGTVNGELYVGGITGRVYEGMVIECYSACVVNSSLLYAGGFAGAVLNIVENCYSTGDVNGNLDFGGFVGYIGLDGDIRKCYSTGLINQEGGPFGGFAWKNDGIVDSTFWDVETSGVSYSDGGTGKISNLMKTGSTYTNAGWDFSTVWGIDTAKNNGYPYLIWQYSSLGTPADFNIVYTSGQSQFTWSAAANATSYKIYSAPEPYAEFPAGWTLEASGITATSWSDTNASASVKKFYKVAAVN